MNKHFKQRALIITQNYAQYNKLQKKLRQTTISYSLIEFERKSIRLPYIDIIYIVGDKEAEPKWRRILYRKGVSIKIDYLERI